MRVTELSVQGCTESDVSITDTIMQKAGVLGERSSPKIIVYLQIKTKECL